MKYSLLVLALTTVVFTTTWFGCASGIKDDTGLQLRKCIGENEYSVLTDLSYAFEQFLQDNGYFNNENDKLNGYRKYLSHILLLNRPDTGWIFRTAELEEIMQRIEKQHIPDLLYDEKISNCVIDINYPDNYLMASYRKIMPQHTVSPQIFAEEFIAGMDKEQFKDPVVKIIIALEYFLGPVLSQLRPNTPASDHGHQH